MAKNYTTKTASLRATKIDTRSVDAKKIKLNGEDIANLWGLNLPEDYPDLVTRCELPADEKWALFND